MRSRFFLILLAIVVIAAVTAGYDPDMTRSVLINGRYASRQLLYDRHLDIRGLRILTQADLLKVLPVERSNLWWRLNSNLISARLTANPLVQSGVVAPCKWYSISCFIVQVSEQNTAAIVIVDHEAWAMNTQGAVISRIASAEAVKKAVNNMPADVPRPLIIEGAWKKNASADQVSARVTVLLRLLGEFQKAAEKHVRYVQLSAEGEGRLTLAGTDLILILDFDQANMITEYAHRFQRIMFEMRGKEQQIASIDLAFNKIAVVKLKGDLR